MIYFVDFREKNNNPLADMRWDGLRHEVAFVAEDLVSAVMQATELLGMIQKRIDGQLDPADRVEMEIISIRQTHTPVLLNEEDREQWVNLIEVETFEDD